MNCRYRASHYEHENEGNTKRQYECVPAFCGVHGKFLARCVHSVDPLHGGASLCLPRKGIRWAAAIRGIHCRERTKSSAIMFCIVSININHVI